MKVFFRVDSSRMMGTGHLMRCLTLANKLRDCSHDVHFITRDHSNNLNHIISEQCFEITVLPKPTNIVKDEFQEDYASWLGVSQDQDALETIAALAGQKPDWIIADHYGLDIAWEKIIRQHTKNLMVIDDLANRQHDCDILLDQNFSKLGKIRYKSLAPESCFLAIGPSYALLRPEYRLHRQCLTPRSGEVKRMLVYFGGSDPHNLTSLVLEALSLKEFDHIEIDLVVGAQHRNFKEIEKQAKQRGRTNLHGHLPHLAQLMQTADLAIGAGGSTTWERMCLNLPSLLVIAAENQRQTSEALIESKLVFNLGLYNEINVTKVAETFKKYLNNPEGVKALSARINDLVDGDGALRVIKLLESSNASDLRVLPNVVTSSDFKKFNLFSGGLNLGELSFKAEGTSISLTNNTDKSLPQIIHPALKAYYASIPRLLGSIRDLPFLNQHKTIQYKLAILSDEGSWLNDYIGEFVSLMLNQGHEILWVHDKNELKNADFCFYLSCGHLVSKSILSKFKHNLVVHESLLPQGKGWSPLSWQVLEGKKNIPITLFEAAEKVDSGSIYLQSMIELEGHELIEELRIKQASSTFQLCAQFIEKYPGILDHKKLQEGDESFYKKRTPKDSLLDPDKSLAQQFNQLRIADNERYPAFFEWIGHKYIVKVSKAES